MGTCKVQACESHHLPLETASPSSKGNCRGGLLKADKPDLKLETVAPTQQQALGLGSPKLLGKAHTTAGIQAPLGVVDSPAGHISLDPCSLPQQMEAESPSQTGSLWSLLMHSLMVGCGWKNLSCLTAKPAIISESELVGPVSSRAHIPLLD